ncbi:MAG TPA: carboxylating nicotinate-nucleotide diphosphorylase [Candidatus Norongarragalinales archaeon]|nr:carboxylating nicotinate-nucleotide diphosphorylase [Candidatus Norongarragalinales archaeon]
MLTSSEKKRLRQFLTDDDANHDITSAITPIQPAVARIKAEQSCTLAGMEEAAFLFRSVGLKATCTASDGQRIQPGNVMEIRGQNRKILSVERTALNVLGRMSGVATLCRHAQKIAGSVRIALTRKTIPGFNAFDKKAARLAGGWPHRKTLSEAVLIKENHLAFFNSVEDAVLAGKKTGKFCEIEVQNKDQALHAQKAGPDMILLDNFKPTGAKKTVQTIRKANPGVKIELSGGINLKNLRKYSQAKPDFISLGLLTRNAQTIDFSLDLFKA